MLLKGNDMYDPLIKVPLIIKYPGRAKGNTATEAMASTVDIAPTILSQCGCEPGKFMKGLDLTKDETAGNWYLRSKRCPKAIATWSGRV